jgi:hypothetical protein
MQEHKMIRFADFSQFPGGSLRAQGDFSGQEFREEHLTPALRSALVDGKIVVVNLDGTMGLSTAFSREAFGGLVAHDGFSPAQLKNILVIVGDEASTRVYIDEAWDYINHAKGRGC